MISHTICRSFSFCQTIKILSSVKRPWCPPGESHITFIVGSHCLESGGNVFVRAYWHCVRLFFSFPVLRGVLETSGPGFRSWVCLGLMDRSLEDVFLLSLLSVIPIFCLHLLGWARARCPRPSRVNAPLYFSQGMAVPFNGFYRLFVSVRIGRCEVPWAATCSLQGHAGLALADLNSCSPKCRQQAAVVLELQSSKHPTVNNPKTEIRIVRKKGIFILKEVPDQTKKPQRNHRCDASRQDRT